MEQPQTEKAYSYTMRENSTTKPIKFDDAEKFIEEDNLYYQKVHQQKKGNIVEAMKWENLYFDEIEDYTREQWLIILFCAIVIIGRMIL